jgi:hypothetical protein
VGPAIGRYSWLSQRQYCLAVAARTPIPPAASSSSPESPALPQAVVQTATARAGEE